MSIEQETTDQIIASVKARYRYKEQTPTCNTCKHYSKSARRGHREYDGFNGSCGIARELGVWFDVKRWGICDKFSIERIKDEP